MADYSNKVATGDSIAALTMVVKPAIEAKQDDNFDKLYVSSNGYS